MKILSSTRTRQSRWLVATIAGPALSAFLWAFVASWARDGKVYLEYSLFCALGACILALVVGLPIHTFLRRQKLSSWIAYAISGAVLGLGMYLGSWLAMSLVINQMDLAPAMSYSFRALRIVPDSPMAILCGALAGSIFWLSFWKQTR